MRATFLHGAGDVRVDTTPDPIIEEPTDALVRVTQASVCGTDLHPYRDRSDVDQPVPMGHEFIGVVEAIGDDVASVPVGDLVIGTFSFQDNTCRNCRAGVQTACVHGGFITGAQAELVRVPLADGTLITLPADVDPEVLPSLLTLTDVYGTGYHAATRAEVGAGDTVAVIGDGAVGLLAVLSAQQRGAERIILMGAHRDRTDLGRDFGATDVVAERGGEGIALVRELTDGGADKIIEAVGHRAAYDQALGIVRPGGVISRVGVPQYVDAPIGDRLFLDNVTLTGGVAPVRAYLDALLPGVLHGTVQPGRVFDRVVDLLDVADGYRAMDAREAIKVRIAVTP